MLVCARRPPHRGQQGNTKLGGLDHDLLTIALTTAGAGFRSLGASIPSMAVPARVGAVSGTWPWVPGMGMPKGPNYASGGAGEGFSTSLATKYLMLVLLQRGY